MKKKIYIVYDGGYMTREYIGFWRGDKQQLKRKLIKLVFYNYGLSRKESEKYVSDMMSIEEIPNLSAKKLESKYADGLNWMGDLRKVKLSVIEEGRKQREKLIKKYKLK